MLFEHFVDECQEWWTAYLRRVYVADVKGQIKGPGLTIFYPNMLLVFDAGEYFICELAGIADHFEDFRVKKIPRASVYGYFNPFDAGDPDGLFHITEENFFSGLTIGHNIAIEKVLERFPYVSKRGSTMSRVDGHGSIFDFQSGFKRLAVMNSTIVNNKGNFYRCKDVLLSITVRKSEKRKDLRTFFNKISAKQDVVGVHAIEVSEGPAATTAGQLQNLYLSPIIRETTIGDFLNSHPEVICRAFQAEDFIYEPTLKWIEHDGSVEEGAINPDFLVRRQDGKYDIYDIKTAALSRLRITKGERKRRRFIDYINEGVSQLVNYSSYFDYAANREYAKSTYGVSVQDPRLYLVVGNLENYDESEVKEASKMIAAVNVIDYDTMIRLFLSAGK